ncbi:CooT family nickel-binding protein [Dethiosulfatarculus sandiegensis]|uniref:RNA-binding protein n=1 Tax=Dethiosulfatarculus sandiegensis TaxID=1429043 RepID=A0A0D2IYQ1_9BACT|nr:CooT family nickel-binding protein [Dethiosulfatarculus sandiegensis]KIX11164.1 RNA-binding protein [Dethiosulfatarculus sandiegensis]
MCEAAVFMVDDSGKEDLVLGEVDLIEPTDDGQIRMVSIFGEQKLVRARIKSTNLSEHKVFLSPM